MPPKDGSASVRAALITAPSSAPAAGEERFFTWQEVAKHNTAASAWVIIDRRVYDITEFMPNHPGGQEMLLLSAGRECTDLFTMYHWWDDAAKARAIMAKYLVGRLAGPTEFPSYPSDTRGFYKTMSARVRAYFVRTGRDPKSPWAGLWRLAVIFAVAFTAYAIVNGRLLAGAPWAVLMLAAAVLGTFQAMPLMHAMHDAAHAAIGHNEVWWKVVGRGCLDVFAGGSMITWHHQHIIGHHVYTNVFKADPDIPCTCVAGAPRRRRPARARARSLTHSPRRPRPPPPPPPPPRPQGHGRRAVP
jgi:cytochrome b involved in lipid metabolism